MGLRHIAVLIWDGSLSGSGSGQGQGWGQLLCVPERPGTFEACFGQQVGRAPGRL